MDHSQELTEGDEPKATQIAASRAAQEKLGVWSPAGGGGAKGQAGQASPLGA